MLTDLEDSAGSHRPMLLSVYAIYFFCGLTLCFEGAFNPEFKELFQLGYQQQMYTMFAKNIPFVLALGIGFAVPRLGYKSCMVLGLALFAVGTLLIIQGVSTRQYGVLLAAFFIIGMGFNFQLVAGNPLLAALGPPSGSASRLNLGNALGAIAQILGPVTLSVLIPVTAISAQQKLPYMKGLFLVVGLLLGAMAIALLFVPLAGLTPGLETNTTNVENPGQASAGWLTPQVALGAATAFLVLGAEAGIFGLFRNYLEDPAIAGLSAHQSQRLFTLYFALFALGRFSASYVQRRTRPSANLAVHLGAAILLLIVVIFARGTLAVVAMVAMGFFISIFFPTIYSLAVAGCGRNTAKASGLLTMGFLGCAVLPVVQGRLADTHGLARSYALWIVPYIFALAFALSQMKRKRPFTQPGSHPIQL